jgi:MFS-type transporter involved in bile tolerance (Atg22 family)
MIADLLIGLGALALVAALGGILWGVLDKKYLKKTGKK